jgi:hypothetical protein
MLKRVTLIPPERKFIVDKMPDFCMECLFYKRNGCADYTCAFSQGTQLKGGFYPTPKDNKYICGLKVLETKE